MLGLYMGGTVVVYEGESLFCGVVLLEPPRLLEEDIGVGVGVLGAEAGSCLGFFVD